MAERPWPPSGPQLEQALTELGTQVAYPAARPLAASVRARLLAERAQAGQAATRTSRTARPPVWRRVAMALLAVVVAAGAVLAASPDARTAVAQWLYLRGVVIFYAPPRATPAPTPLGTHLQLGGRLSLGAAQRRVHYHIQVPTLTVLGAPNEVYVGVPAGDNLNVTGQAPLGKQTALLYRAGAMLPRIGRTDIGMLLTEVPGNPGVEQIFYAKFVAPGTRLQLVAVQGTVGYWLSGRPHLFFYTDPRGIIITESVRLAGNVLLWGHNGLTLRLESALTKDVAVRIANSLR